MDEFIPMLDKNSSEPLFQQLYRLIRQEIVSGSLVRNEKLPSKRRLADSLQCSQNTVQAAYNQLVDEGYLLAREKSGYYVAELDGILSLGREPQPALLETDRSDEYDYDFSYQGVDLACFPFSIWRKLARETIHEQDKDLLRTGDPQGYPPLRAAIARYLHQSRGVNCSPDQIIISSGTEYLLLLLIQLLDRSFSYAIENPGYEKLAMIFKSSRVEHRPIRLDKHGLRPDDLADSGANVACITPSHQFPTGSIMPVSRRIMLLNWANQQPDRYIVEDDYDSEFRYSGKPIPSLQGLDKNGKVIYMGAFSKSLSPALRISYMVLPEKLRDIYLDRLTFYICPVPTIEQKTLHRFIDEGHFERHVNRARNLYRQKRERLAAAIRDLLPGASIDGAMAGLHIVLRTGDGRSEAELIELARKSGVKVYGSERFYSEPETASEAASDVNPGAALGAVANAVSGPQPCRLILGFATLQSEEIEQAVARLKRAWGA